ncbi:MAG: transglycosylase family protein [Acidimicrobiales bacterium]
MRIRIALGTAIAVIAIPAILFALFSSTSAASARVSRHEASSRQRAVKINDTLMSYAQARNASKMVTYANAVEAGQVQTYLSEIAYLKTAAYLKAIAAQQAAAAQAASAAAAARAQVAAVPAPAPAPAPSGGNADATSTTTPDWACIRQHESGGNYSIGNGGAYQFELSTWNALTGLPSPAEDYPPAVQDAAALKLYSQRGWEPWTTRYACGL